MNTRPLVLAALFAAPSPAFAATLEAQAYESHRLVEPVIPAEDLERHLVAQTDTHRIEIEHRQAPDIPRLNKRQKQQVLMFMGAGALLGALTGGVFGALVGMAAGGMVWYLLAWAEVI